MKEIMKASLLSNDLALWPSIGLVLFTLVMIGVIFWVLRPGSKEYYQTITSSILEGEASNGQGTRRR